MTMPQPVRTAAAVETELIARAREREEAAIRTLVQRYNRRLYRLARGIVRDDSEAEDVLQEAYLRAFTHLDGFRGEAGFGTWLGRIVINEALGRVRRRRPIVVEWTPDREAPSGDVIPFPHSRDPSDPERSMAQREIMTLLERAIDSLPEAFRTVLVARVVEEMSVEETALLLGVRPETVKTRLHRARELLKRAMEEQIGPMLTEAFPFEGRRCARMADAVIARLFPPR